MSGSPRWTRCWARGPHDGHPDTDHGGRLAVRRRRRARRRGGRRRRAGVVDRAPARGMAQPRGSIPRSPPSRRTTRCSWSSTRTTPRAR
ncbi:hypothetical protein NKH77_08105 [Streptomyces sp. M19]